MKYNFNLKIRDIDYNINVKTKFRNDEFEDVIVKGKAKSKYNNYSLFITIAEKPYNKDFHEVNKRLGIVTLEEIDKMTNEELKEHIKKRVEYELMKNIEYDEEQLKHMNLTDRLKNRFNN